MIEISSYDLSLLGKKWNPETLGWEEVTPVVVEPVKTTEQELAEVKENQLILMDAVATLYETMTGGTA